MGEAVAATRQLQYVRQIAFFITRVHGLRVPGCHCGHRVGELRALRVRVRNGRPDAPVIVPTRENKVTTGTLAVKLDLVGGEAATIYICIRTATALARAFSLSLQSRSIF